MMDDVEGCVLPWTLRACMVAGLILCAGCVGEPKLTPVEGTVRFRGSPLPGGTIVFAPDADRGGRGQLAVAEIGLDGRYSLRTRGQPGCVPGWHRVTIAASHSSGVNLPDHYRDPDLSRQTVEVRANLANTHDILLD